MKVLHVIPSMSAEHGGPSSALATLSHHLLAQGVEVTIATTASPHPPLGEGREAPSDDFNTMSFRLTASRYYLSLPLLRWLDQNVGQFDLVHVHELFTFPSAAAAWAATRAGVPYIVTPHAVLMRWGLENRRPRLKRIWIALLERRVLRRAAAVHFTSEVERFESGAVLAHHRQEVLPFGVDRSQLEHVPALVPFLRRRPSFAGRPLLLVLSRLHPIKRIEIALNAFRSLHNTNPSAALVIAGDGDSAYVELLHQHTKDLGLDAHVWFSGFLTPRDRAAALLASSILLQASSSEGFGMAVVEAMAVGLPVVTTSGFALQDEITHAGAGLCVPCDAEAIADACRALLEDDVGRNEMGLRAKALVAERFSAEQSTARFLELYSSVVRTTI